MDIDSLFGPDEFPAGTAFEVAGSAQRGLWLTQQLDPVSTAYLIRHAFELTGPLDVPALAGALRLLVARHEALRTAFVPRGDELYQAIYPGVDEVLTVHELSGDVEGEVAREQATPFDLSRPPLLRARLLRVARHHHVLVVAFHHIVVDGASVELLWRDLGMAYTALSQGRSPELPELPLQYADYAAWEQDWLKTPDYERQLGFWRDRLATVPAAIDLPTATRAVGPLWQGGSHDVWLAEPETTAVLRLAAAHGVTPFMALLMVFSGVLYRWSDQSDVVVGTPMSLRDQPGLERVVGMLVNTVPVRVTWGDDPPTGEALRRVGAAVVEALAAKQVPFHHLVKALPALRRLGRSPVVQVMFGYEEGHDGAAAGLRLPGLDVRAMPAASETAKFDLSLDCLLSGGRLRCAFEWSDQRLDAPLVELFAEHFVAALRHVITRPDARVGEWPLHDLPAPPPGAEAFLDDDLSDEPWATWSALTEARGGSR